MDKTKSSASSSSSSCSDLDFPKRRTTTSSSTPQPPFSSPFTSKTCLRSTSKSSPQNPQSPSAISVFLKDWWLTNVDGKHLAVGGFASRLSVGVREFSSSVIARRHCATTLETADGTMIMINGMLNMSRSHQNGFPSEVCYPFLHGFPYNWEEYADLDASKSTRASAESLFSEKNENNSLLSLNDLPVSAIRDCLLSSLGHTDYDQLIKNLYKDALGSSLSDHFENSRASMDSNRERKRSASNKKSGATDIPTTQKRNVGVRTRSMTRMKRNASAAVKCSEDEIGGLKSVK